MNRRHFFASLIAGAALSVLERLTSPLEELCLWCEVQDPCSACNPIMLTEATNPSWKSATAGPNVVLTRELVDKAMAALWRDPPRYRDWIKVPS